MEQNKNVFTSLNIYNGTLKIVPQDVKGQPLPINQLKGNPHEEDCSISNVHWCILDDCFDPEIFIIIGKSLSTEYELEKEVEEELIEEELIKKELIKKEKKLIKEKEDKRIKEENEIAIEILQKKIREFEDSKKKKGFFSKLFESKKDLINETLEIEKYYYNKCLLEKLQNINKM